MDTYQIDWREGPLYWFTFCRDRMPLSTALVSRTVWLTAQLNLWAKAADDVDHAHTSGIDQYYIVIHRGVLEAL